MYLILLGAPGTGKGTQAKILADRFGWKHISTGDMLREEVATGSELGCMVRDCMQRGELVPDDVVIRMLTTRICMSDATQGFILDGFPRNLPQAEALDAALESQQRRIDIALNLAASDEELVQRLAGRWLCRGCGAIYQELANPPRVKSVCDSCSGTLTQREDDRPETIRARLQQQKPPAAMLAYYRNRRRLVDVNGMQPIERVTADVLYRLSSTATGITEAPLL